MKRIFKCKYHWHCGVSVSISNHDKKYRKYKKEKFVCENCKKEKEQEILLNFKNKFYFYSSNISKLDIHYLNFKQLKIKIFLVKEDFLEFKKDNILFFNKKLGYLGFLENVYILNDFFNNILKNKIIKDYLFKIKDKKISDLNENISFNCKKIEDNFIKLNFLNKEKEDLELELNNIKKNSFFYIFNKRYNLIEKELKEKKENIYVFKENSSIENKELSLNTKELCLEINNLSNISLYNLLKDYYHEQNIISFIKTNLLIDLK